MNGNDLKALGFNGAEIGNMLEHLLELVTEGQCENSRDALLGIAEEGLGGK